MTTLSIYNSIDYSHADLLGIDEIQFVNPGYLSISLSFSASQFDGKQILSNVTFNNADFDEHVFVTLDSSHTHLDARGWQFVNCYYDFNGNIYLTGSGSDDVIFGPNEGSRIYGEGGSNLLVGGSADDTISGSGNDTLIGGAGDDNIESGSGGVAKINGGAGNDTADIDRTSSTTSFNIDMRHGGVGADIGDGTTLRSIEFLVFHGGYGNDHVVGGLQGSVLDGGTGNDYLAGFGLTNNLYGGTGEDVIVDHSTASSLETPAILDGGDGSDLLVLYRIAAATDLIFSVDDNSAGTVTLADYTRISGFEQIHFYSGSGNDSITGGALADLVWGNNGNDALSGLGGNDKLLGGDGNDTLSGGNGADQITGGAGFDMLTGGLGNDTFIYASLADVGDTITDFSSNASGNNDTVKIFGAGFGSLPSGWISAAEFQSSNSDVALSASVRFFFEKDTGILRFDDDGSGSDAAIIIATLQAGATMTYHDILIV